MTDSKTLHFPELPFKSSFLDPSYCGDKVNRALLPPQKKASDRKVVGEHSQWDEGLTPRNKTNEDIHYEIEQAMFIAADILENTVRLTDEQLTYLTIANRECPVKEDTYFSIGLIKHLLNIIKSPQPSSNSLKL